MATIDQTLESGTWMDHGHLSIRTERDPEELLVVEFFGELDLAGVEAARRELQRAGEGGVEEVMVDLSGLDFIDCSGLRVLREADQAARVDGHPRLRFLRGQGQVERIFKLTRLDESLPFAD